MQHGHDVHDDEQLVTHPEQVEDVAARRLRREHVHDADEQDEQHARETCEEWKEGRKCFIYGYMASDIW